MDISSTGSLDPDKCSTCSKLLINKTEIIIIINAIPPLHVATICHECHRKLCTCDTCAAYYREDLTRPRDGGRYHVAQCRRRAPMVDDAHGRPWADVADKAGCLEWVQDRVFTEEKLEKRLS